MKNNMTLTAKDICEATGATMPAAFSPDDEFATIATSAWQVKEGCLGIHFQELDIKTAFEKGAKAILTEENIEDDRAFIVDNYIDASYELCKLQYSKIKSRPSILVTGSTGKTTTKNMLSNLLVREFNTFYIRGNYNTINYLLTFLPNINDEHEIILIEMAESLINETKYTSDLLKPEIVCITNMQDSHIGKIGSQEKINEQIAGITYGLKKDGICIINADDLESSKYKFDCNVVSVGIENKNATYIAKNIKETSKGTTFEMMYDGKNNKIKISHPGIHNVYNAMMTFVAGKKEGISDRKIKKAIKSYKPSSIRQNIIKREGRVLYIDCFNTNATSVAFALKTFSNIPVKNGKRVAVIGDMYEIDGHEEEIYKNMAKAIDDVSIDILITYGDKSSMIKNNLTKEVEYYHVRTNEEMSGLLREIDSNGGRNYLFKAGRRLKLEQAVKEVFPDYIRQSEKEEKKRDKIAAIKKRYLPFLK